jgi:hypothetical protein
MVLTTIAKLYRALIIALIVSVMALPIFAQLPSGTILGVVKDASGSLVAGATVTVRNIDTGQVRTVTTDRDGAYRVSALPVGRYEVRAEQTGFKAAIRSDIKLEVTQEVVINFDLEVGSAHEIVNVVGQPDAVNTTNGSLGGLVDSEKMENLPLNGRNYVSLVLLQPGIMEDKAVNYEGGAAGTIFSSNGATPWSNYFMLDGAPLMNALGYGSGSSAGTTLGVSGIQEFKVITTGVDATYGMAMGAQVVMVSKSGTNEFHGDAFDYLRNSIFDARNYFDLAYTLPGGSRLPHLSRNDFGGSIGGPIKKDKTFFYAVYEGLRQAQGVTTIDSVMAAGCHGPAGAMVWNGQGNRPAGSIGPCTQLGVNPSGTGTNSARISKAIAPLLALYPVPNLPNNQFTFPSTDPTTADYGQIRIDHNFSQSDTLFGRYTITRSFLDTTNVQNSTANNGPGYPGYQLAWPGQDQFFTLSENHIFSNQVLNTGRISFSRNTLTQLNDVPSGIPTGPMYSFINGIPMGSIAIGSVSGPYGINTSRPSYNYQTVYTISDDLFYIRGRHSLKFGTLLHRYYEALNSAATLYGNLQFPSIASFLQGTNATYNSLTAGSITSRYYAYNTLGFYAQDDWRATSRLTLNLGLRYEFMTTVKELNGYQSAVRNIATDAVGTIGPIMKNPSYYNFGPRLGFAYDIGGTGQTVIRGAWGIYYDIGNLGSEFREELSGTPPFAAQDAVRTSRIPITIPLTYPPGSLGTFIQTVNYEARQPRMLEWNLTVEHQFPFGITFGMSYVGMRGTNLWSKGEGNPTIPTLITNGTSFWGPLIPVCSSIVPSCRVNPNFTSIAYDANLGHSWYDSLQINLNKQLSHSLQFQVAYTWGKNLDDTENMSGDSGSSSGCSFGEDPTNRQLSKGPSCFDIAQMARINLIYYLPKTSVSNKFISTLANGWWVGNIVSLQSGYPFTPVLTTQRSRSGVNVGSGSQPDRVNLNTAASIAATFPSKCTSLPGQPPAGANPCLYTPIPYDASSVITGDPNHWFNPAMFSLGPVGFLGNAGRDILRGPGLATWDFSMVKNTPIRFPREGSNLEFRAEFFNILNRANFGIPPGSAFTGALADTGPYSELPLSTAGRITNTSTTSRQIQFALKLQF